MSINQASPIYIHYWKSPAGELLLGSYEEMLCLCDWRHRKMRNSVDHRIQKFIGSSFKKGESEVIKNTISQLEEYFSGNRKDFNIPLALAGTSFQTSVWNALLSVDYGKTESYLSLSKKLQNEKAIRAVASANGANAISILVPCHRIIGSNGELTGYAGGLAAKKKLLELEGALVMNQTSLF